MDVLGKLRRALEEESYADSVTDATRNPAVAQRRVAAEGHAKPLVELFAFGLPVDAGSLPFDSAALARAGLLEEEQGRVRALVRIDAWDGLFLLHDPDPPTQRDHVIGVNNSSRTLASLTVRSPVAHALDLGTGSGVQALAAARHADEVVATDVNDRALWLAALNARLNGVANVDWRKGNLFEPVETDRFGLVVSNPPYVVSPDRDYIFRDANAAALVPAAVGGACDRLEEGGFATILCNWPLRAGEEWAGAPGTWVEGRSCDAWLVYYGSQDPLDYAAAWNLTLHDDQPAFEAALDRWLGFYGQTGIAEICTGGLILRRRSGARNWFRADEATLKPTTSASAQILRVFAAETVPPRRLFGMRLALVEHRLDQALGYADGSYGPQPAQLTLPEGVGVQAEVEPEVLHVLFLLDGRRTLIEAIAAAEAATGLDVRDAALRAAQLLLQLGFATFDANPTTL